MPERPSSGPPVPVRPLGGSSRSSVARPRWGVDPAPAFRPGERLALAAVAPLPAPILCAVVAAGAGRWWGAGAAVAEAAAVLLWVRVQDRMALRAAGARPLTAVEDPR